MHLYSDYRLGVGAPPDATLTVQKDSGVGVIVAVTAVGAGIGALAAGGKGAAIGAAAGVAVGILVSPKKVTVTGTGMLGPTCDQPKIVAWAAAQTPPLSYMTVDTPEAAAKTLSTVAVDVLVAKSTCEVYSLVGTMWKPSADLTTSLRAYTPPSAATKPTAPPSTATAPSSEAGIGQGTYQPGDTLVRAEFHEWVWVCGTGFAEGVCNWQYAGTGPVDMTAIPPPYRYEIEWSLMERPSGSRYWLRVDKKNY